MPEARVHKTNSSNSSEKMKREPLTERSAFGRAQQNRIRMTGPQKRTYGKGGTASSRAVLSNQFLDENEIDQQMPRISPGQAGSPLPLKDDAKLVSARASSSLARKGTESQRLPAADSEAVAYLSPLLAESLTPKGLCDFSAWAEKVARTFKVVKVAEGSFGEVFKLEKKDDLPSSASSTTTAPDPDAPGGCIFKLIPIRPKPSRSESQTSLDSLIHEVRMLKCMDPIPGFTRFREITVLQGLYAPSFAEAHDAFRVLKARHALNAPPYSYKEKQLWAMLEMDDGGQDLEILKKPSTYQIFDIFWLTCCALSYAEELAEFEHRDLHVGNICIKSTQPDGKLDILHDVNAAMQAQPSSNFGHSGLRTTIIDYTFSRARYDRDAEITSDDTNTTTNPSKLPTPKAPTILFDPFKDLSMFKKTGRTLEERDQNDIYRAMHKHAIKTETQSRATDHSLANKQINKWARFLPRTNVMWLKYLLSTLLRRSQRATLPSSSAAAEKLQEGILVVLERLLEILQGESLDVEGNGVPQSAGQVVAMAIDEGLITQFELDQIKKRLED